MPLPHISACEPSALRWSMNHSQRSSASPSTAGGVGDVHRPDDAQDAVAAEAGPAVAEPADHRRVQPGSGQTLPSGSGSTTKSFSVPCPRSTRGPVCDVTRPIVRSVITEPTASTQVGPGRRRTR